MTQVVLPVMDDSIYAQLKRRAEIQNRTIEAEILAILEKAANERVIDMNSFRAKADSIRRSLENRAHSDSSELIRETRS